MIRDLKAKLGRDWELKVCLEGGMPKITLGIKGLHAKQISGCDYGIEGSKYGLKYGRELFIDRGKHVFHLIKSEVLLVDNWEYASFNQT